MSRFGKTEHFGATNGMHFIAPYHRSLIHYQNTVIDYQEMARSAFPHGFFMVMQKTEKPVKVVRNLWGGCNRTT